MAWYTADHNDTVNKLVLLAPQWVRETPGLADPGGAIGAYRIVERAAAKLRWLNGVPEHKKAELLPEAWFEAWADATFASGQSGPGPAQLMAPNGTIQDATRILGGRQAALRSRPHYRPGPDRPRRMGS